MYTELQVGVMPTQYQGFPMKAGATREWTEYFTTAAVATGTATDTATGAAMDTAEGGKGSSPLDLHALHSPDYHGVAIPTVDAFLDEKKVGGNHTAEFDRIDRFLERLADVTPVDEHILHSGAGWGALEALRRGKTLSPGTLFPVNKTLLMADRDIRPWFELVDLGTFSEETLAMRVTSFSTTATWMDILQKSMDSDKKGPTWLHLFHLGVGYMDRCLVPGDAMFAKAEVAFKGSMALKETPEAHRNLAIIEHSRHNHAAAFGHYEAALKWLGNPKDLDPDGSTLLMRDIAAESMYHFGVLQLTNYTAKLVAPGSLVPESARFTDRFRFGAAQAAFGTRNWKVFFKLCDCGEGRLWPAIGWWGGGTEQMLAWYQEAILLRETEVAGHPLNVVETNAVIRANPVPFCLRAVGH